MECLQNEKISIKMPRSCQKMSETEPRPQNKSQRRRHRPIASNSSNSDEGAEVESPEKAKKQTKLRGPTKAETALLPPFSGLSPDQILIPATLAECRDAVDEIFASRLCGFDTEAKPTFRKGQKCHGPHVVQFALTNKAFIFQLHRGECEKAAGELIASKEVLKVGFSLKNDHGQIRRRFGLDLNHVLDLDQTFRKLGYSGQIGVRGAIGVLLKQCFKKSKSTTTSNWALSELTSRQLIYAANDAYAALKIMESLQAEGRAEI